jgi:hypothetical protein
MANDIKDFWITIDNLLSERKASLVDMCEVTGIVYGTVNSQRVRGSLPKLDQLHLMAQYFGTSIENLVYPQETFTSPKLKRINNIRKACLIASEEDLLLVERILRIDNKNAFDNLAKPYTLRTK